MQRPSVAVALIQLQLLQMQNSFFTVEEEEEEEEAPAGRVLCEGNCRSVC